ncbi:MAG: EVE domain-containing protein [Candidatus Tyrphobacter sp.]
MPVVLSQRTWHDDPKYLDREGVIYHYPRQYRGRINDFDRFIYYRPATGACAEERSTYVGHGILGTSFEDWARSDHYFMNVAWYEPFERPVPLRQRDIFVETESATSPPFQSAARPIRETAYYRILMLGGVSAGREFAPPVTTESVLSAGYSPLLVEAPRDAFREAVRIPEGTGYVPSGRALPSVYESAALQERARKDHNATLDMIRRHAERLGGRCWYNNNIDLFVRYGDQSLLVEAKSLNDARQSVDRMRYGLGQLFDYRVRYKAEVAGAEPVLAFGAPPDRASGWITTILQENGVAFVARDHERLVPLNERATAIALFAVE